MHLSDPLDQAAHESEDAGATTRLGPEAFALEFQAAHRRLWLIGVGVVRDPSLCDDVVQEAALIALTRLDQFDPATSFPAWMGQIVRFVALNHRRREQKRRTSPAAAEAIDRAEQPERPGDLGLHLTPGGGAEWDREGLDERLVHALDAVSDVPRTCLLLRVVEGLGYAEISELLDIPEGTAMSHVHRTRRFLRDHLRSDKDADLTWKSRA